METNDLSATAGSRKKVTTGQIVTICLNYINNTLRKQENIILIPDREAELSELRQY